MHADHFSSTKNNLQVRKRMNWTAATIPKTGTSLALLPYKCFFRQTAMKNVEFANA